MPYNPFVVEITQVELSTEKLQPGDPVILTDRTDSLRGAALWRVNCDLGFLGYIKGEDARRLSFRVDAQGSPRAVIASLDPLNLEVTFHDRAVQTVVAGGQYSRPSGAGLMVGGFMRGILGTICQLGGVAFLLIWIFSGFYSPVALIIAIGLFVGGAYMSYVSRHTVKTRN